MKPEIRVGQVWGETDPRSADRQFVVVAVLDQLGCGPVVEVTNTAGPHRGRRSYIRLDRLHPTFGKRGYGLKEEVPR